MKVFQRKINGQVYKGELFERLDILNKFNRTEEEWLLIDKYQKTFPQLLLDDVEGFIIDARTLWKELGEPQGEFNKWVKRKIIEMYREDKDFELSTNLSKTSKGGRPEENYILTLETAKSLALGVGTTKNSSEEIREKGRLIRDYFILIEKILKKYEVWSEVRKIEKDGWNEMKIATAEWCQRKEFDFLNDYFYIREANMLNEALTGKKAVEIRAFKNVLDNQTRDNLDKEINRALSELQQINMGLLDSDMEFEERKSIIENRCRRKFKHIKEKFNK